MSFSFTTVWRELHVFGKDFKTLGPRIIVLKESDFPREKKKFLNTLCQQIVTNDFLDFYCVVLNFISVETKKKLSLIFFMN